MKDDNIVSFDANAPDMVERRIFDGAARQGTAREEIATTKAEAAKRAGEQRRAANLREAEEIARKVEKIFDRMDDPKKLFALLEQDAKEPDRHGKVKTPPYTSHVLLWLNKKDGFPGPIENPQEPSAEKVSLAKFCQLIEKSESFRRLRERLEKAGIRGVALQAFPVAKHRNLPAVKIVESKPIGFVGGYAVILSFSTGGIPMINRGKPQHIDFNFPYNRDMVWYAKKVTRQLTLAERAKNSIAPLKRWLGRPEL